VGILISALVGAAVWAGPADDLYRQTRYAEALQAVSGALDGKNASAYLLAGRAAFGLRDFKKASEYLEQATALAPSDSVARHWLGRAMGRRAETAFPLAMPGLASKARQHFEKAVSLDSRNYEALEDLFTFYTMAPGFMGGGLERAEGLVTKFEAIGAAEGEYARARMQEERKQYAQSEAHWRRASELAPKSAGRLLDMARFLSRRGRVAEGLEWVARAEKLTPGAPEVLYGKAEYLIEAKRDLQAARGLLEQYLKAPLNPDLPSRFDVEKLLKKTR